MIARASLPHDAATLRFLLLFSLYHLSPKQRDGVGDSKAEATMTSARCLGEQCKRNIIIV
jgi:hypothetical protein